MENITLHRKYDLRPTDFVTGKKAPISKEDMGTCDCCGARICVVNEFSNGMTLGSECAWFIEKGHLNDDGTMLSFLGASKKQIKFFKSLK